MACYLNWKDGRNRGLISGSVHCLGTCTVHNGNEVESIYLI